MAVMRTFCGCISTKTGTIAILVFYGVSNMSRGFVCVRCRIHWTKADCIGDFAVQSLCKELYSHIPSKNSLIRKKLTRESKETTYSTVQWDKLFLCARENYCYRLYSSFNIYQKSVRSTPVISTTKLFCLEYFYNLRLWKENTEHSN